LAQNNICPMRKTTKNFQYGESLPRNSPTKIVEMNTEVCQKRLMFPKNLPMNRLGTLSCRIGNQPAPPIPSTMDRSSNRVKMEKNNRLLEAPITGTMRGVITIKIVKHAGRMPDHRNNIFRLPCFCIRDMPISRNGAPPHVAKFNRPSRKSSAPSLIMNSCMAPPSRQTTAAVCTDAHMPAALNDRLRRCEAKERLFSCFFILFCIL